ncbi:MAG: aldo/keto reductase [Lachnospiraceae bacterium]|nr:aldo/keto reductase [Lachnospiraceae bacterium]
MQTLFDDEIISGMAQVILCWHLQAGNIAIHDSSNEDHIQENFEIFDFELTDEEMVQMTRMNGLPSIDEREDKKLLQISFG